MAQTDGHQLQDFVNNITLPPTLHRMLTYRWEKQRQMSWIGDISISISPISPNHFNNFFILGVEDLFLVGNWILKVENFGSKSRLINWKACLDDNCGI
jgi:hypothetical protein